MLSGFNPISPIFTLYYETVGENVSIKPGSYSFRTLEDVYPKPFSGHGHFNYKKLTLTTDDFPTVILSTKTNFLP